MSSRPIQYAEKQFFATLWKGNPLKYTFPVLQFTDANALVPVLAIITKFDIFQQDVLQELEEKADEEACSERDDEDLEGQALEEAKRRFDMHYRIPLMALQYPPMAVLALSDSKYSQL